MTLKSGENANITLRKENEDLKRRLCELDTLLPTTMETVKEVRDKYRKLLCSNDSEKESQLKQDILALETFVRWLPIQTMGRSEKYSKYFKGPNSGSG